MAFRVHCDSCPFEYVAPLGRDAYQVAIRPEETHPRHFAFVDSLDDDPATTHPR